MNEISSYFSDLSRKYIKRLKTSRLRTSYHIIPPQESSVKESSWYLFHPYSLSLFEIQDEIEAKILKLYEIYKNFKKVSYVLGCEENKAKDVIDEYTNLLLKKHPSHFFIPTDALSISLIVTNDCQMRCRYCYTGSGDLYNYQKTNKKKMSSVIAIKAINVLYELFPAIKTIEFFGGEPLLNIEAIKSTLKHISENYPEIQPGIVTNGLLINKKLAELFSRYNVPVTVSLDGFRETNDITRKLKGSGEGTFSKIQKAIECLKKYGVEVSIESTYSPDHFELGYTPIEVIKFLDSIKSEKGALLFKIMAEFDLLKHSQINEFESEFNSRLLIELYKCIDYIFKRNISDTPLYEATFLYAIGRLLSKETSLFSCPFTNSITVLPDGSVFSCQVLMKKEFYMGNVGDKDLQENFIERLRSPMEMSFIPNIDTCRLWYYPLQDICPGITGFDILKDFKKISQSNYIFMYNASYWERFLINYAYILKDVEKQKKLIENIESRRSL